MTRGVFTFFKFIWDTGFLLFLIPLPLLVRAKKEIVFIFWLILFQVLYTIYVGGDVFYYFGRYVMVTVPLFFILFASATNGIIKYFNSYLKGENLKVLFTFLLSPAHL